MVPYQGSTDFNKLFRSYFEFFGYFEQEPRAIFPAAPALLHSLLEILSGSCTLQD
jgi:hypothetical protein